MLIAGDKFNLKLSLKYHGGLVSSSYKMLIFCQDLFKSKFKIDFLFASYFDELHDKVIQRLKPIIQYFQK